MKQVAKLVIIDDDDKYLLLHRNAHPTFGNDPDLPGGTLENDELPVETMVREVYEETNIVVNKAKVLLVYEGTDYSTRGTHYSLYTAKLDSRPTVVMSWEHSTYEWLDRETFLKKAKSANDTYMHMVYNKA